MSKKQDMPKFGPLQGMRVVFSAMEIAGPFSAQLFAEWGAEVIWIENVAYADTIRVQTNYCELSRRNLYALSLNVFADEGREAFLKLLETPDVFIEASKGPAFARHGIPDELMWQHNPKLVIAHLSGFGQYGDDRYTNLAAYNTIAQAFSGYLIQNGDKDQPMPAFPYTADYLAGLMVTSSVLAAVYNAQKTGVGESIDAAMYEVLLLVGQYYMINYFNGGKLCPRMTKGKDPIWVGCGLYKCKDAYLVMEIVGARQIEDMLEILGLKHLIGTVGMPKGAQLIPRECPSGELVEDKLDAYMADRPVEEVLKTLAELRVAAAKVLTVPELESNPQYVARDSFIEWDTMAGRKFKGPNIVPKFKKHPGQVWRAMPSQGMDTAGILAELGYSEADIRALAEKKIVKLGTAPERS